MFTGETNLKDLPEIDELWHHGVKGQQWGVQNGPPYPLDKLKKYNLSKNDMGRITNGDVLDDRTKKVLKIEDSQRSKDDSSITKEWNSLLESFMNNPSPKEYSDLEKSVKNFKDKLTLPDNHEFTRTLIQIKEKNLKDNWSNLKTSEDFEKALADLNILYQNDADDRYAFGTLGNWYDALTNELSKLKHSDHLEHYGILGQKWGDQNGPPYPLNPSQKSYSEKKQARMDKKWIRKNDKKIRRYADSQSREELKAYEKELRKVMPKYNKNGKINSNYATAYSKKMADLYNKAIGDLVVGSGSGSGKVVKFVAARGQMDVFTALADYGYDMSNVRNGVYDSGRIGYRKESVGVDRDERK